MAKPAEVEAQIARLERALTALRAKLERQKAAAEDTRMQMDLFEEQIVKLKGAR